MRRWTMSVGVATLAGLILAGTVCLCTAWTGADSGAGMTILSDKAAEGVLVGWIGSKCDGTAACPTGGTWTVVCTQLMCGGACAGCVDGTYGGPGCASGTRKVCTWAWCWYCDSNAEGSPCGYRSRPYCKVFALACNGVGYVIEPCPYKDCN